MIRGDLNIAVGALAVNNTPKHTYTLHSKTSDIRNVNTDTNKHTSLISLAR